MPTKLELITKIAMLVKAVPTKLARSVKAVSTLHCAVLLILCGSSFNSAFRALFPHCYNPFPAVVQHCYNTFRALFQQFSSVSRALSGDSPCATSLCEDCCAEDSVVSVVAVDSCLGRSSCDYKIASIPDTVP
jgi:hypothetical protein